MPTLKLYPQTLVIFCILAVALLLRVFELSSSPSGFHADEASFALNAKAILETGMDEDGRSFPLSLNSFIDPKPALFSYLQIPFIATISNTSLASRLPSALLGVISIYLIFLVIKNFSNEQLAQIVALVTTVSPWHIMMSRGTQEVILSFVFFLSFLLGFQKILFESKRLSSVTEALYWVLSVSSAFLAGYVYHSAKVVIPLFTVMTLFILFYGSKKQLISLSKSVLLTLSILFAITVSFFVQESSSRLAAVNIFTESGYQQQLIEQIYTASADANTTVIRIFYNKLQTYTFALAENYLDYFSPDFLFFEAAKPTRYQIPNHGLLFLIELPLMLYGIFTMIRKKTKYATIFWILLILAPLPSAVTTQETPSMIRSFLLFISLSFFIAMGIQQLLEQKNSLLKFFFSLILLSAYVWSLGYFWMQYSIQAKYTQPWFRNSPYTQIAEFVSENTTSYSQIKVTNDLRPLYAYFALEDIISIESLQSQPLARNQDTYTFDSVTFNKDVCNFDSIQTNTLYIVETGCKEKNQKLDNLVVIKTIEYDDGTPAYEILELPE